MCNSKEQLLASNLLQDQQGKSEHFEFLRVTLNPLLIVVIKPAGRADARIPVLQLILQKAGDVPFVNSVSLKCWAIAKKERIRQRQTEKTARALPVQARS